MFKLIFGITGASGVVLAHRIIDFFSQISDIELHFIFSDHAASVMESEPGRLNLKLKKCLNGNVYDSNDFAAPPASGSWPADGMLICPCSLNTLGAIANGITLNLIHRAAQVTLKERKPLILTVRETPYSLIALRNMVQATEAGAIVMPFSPAFYIDEPDLDNLIKQYAGHILDLFHIPNNIRKRWKHE